MKREKEVWNIRMWCTPLHRYLMIRSEVLVLGSFPSVKSREHQFYYGHPQNRFWKVTAGVFGEDIPQTIEEKQAFLLRNHVEYWDVNCLLRHHRLIRQLNSERGGE